MKIKKIKVLKIKMILLKKDKKQAGKKIKINLNKNYKKWNRLARIRIKKWNKPKKNIKY